MGSIDDASAAVCMRTSYNSLQLVLLVGVCSAVPFASDTEILLGHVVISKSVVRYGFGRQYPGKFVRNDTVEDNLCQPSSDIRGLLLSFETDHSIELLEQQTAEFLQELQTKAAVKRRIGKDKYKDPGARHGILFEPNYQHKHRLEPICACRDCQKDTDPVCDEALGLTCDKLGYGEGHTQSRKRRDEKLRLEREGDIMAQNVIAFEMEGGGVWDAVPCLVVKGVCDYADCHKHKGRQNFAAATAASAAKAILQRYIQTDKGQDGTTYENQDVRAQDEIGRGSIGFGNQNSGSPTGINHGTDQHIRQAVLG